MIKHVLRLWFFSIAVTLLIGEMSSGAFAQDIVDPASQREKEMQELDKIIKAAENEMSAIGKQQQEKQEKKNQAIIQIAEAIKAGECKALQAKLEKEINWFEGTMQLINARGVCGQKTPKMAFGFMKAITQNSPRDEKAWAYLGQFYEQGIGTEVDLTKAKHAYQFAVRALGVQVLKTEWNEDEYHPNRSIAKHWGLSAKDYVWSFSNPVLGPIEISPLLEEEIQWLKGIEVVGGEAVFTEAQNMLRQGQEGSTGWFASIVDWVLDRQNDTKGNLALGLEWLDIAGGKYGYVPAYYPLAKAFRNLKIIVNIPEYFLNHQSFAAKKSNIYLVEALKTGTKKALMPVIELYRKSEDVGNNKFRLYYLLLVAQKEGHQVSQEELNKYKNSLEAFQSAGAELMAQKNQIDDMLVGIVLPPKFNLYLPN